MSHDVPAGARPEDVARLLIRCPDRPGIVAAVSGFLFGAGANIISSSQFSTDPLGGTFLLRAAIHLPGVQERRAELEADFAGQVAASFGMDWTLTLASERKRVAIMVSRQDHCALDLLWRSQRGQLPIEIGLVISNHPDLAEAVESFGVRFLHTPVEAGGRDAAEQRQLELLQGRFDLLVLARYMQILSGRFLEQVGCPVINIHHSFLPAFAGAQPYLRAKERGVKLIGATAHYATAELDAGPIIEQDTVRVSHADTAADLERRGADVERAVLARAVEWHCDDRVVRLETAAVVL